MIRYLIHNGADINMKNSHGQTVLHIAVSSLLPYQKPDMIRLLIANGAEIDIQDNYGQTPIHIASGKGRKDIVQLFIEQLKSSQSQKKGGRRTKKQNKKKRKTNRKNRENNPQIISL
jgi:ankyrin repeat protein